MNGLLAVGDLEVQRLNMDCLMKFFQHSNSECSSRMFAILGYSKHSLEQCSLVWSAAAILYSFSFCFAQNSFEGSKQQIYFGHLENEVKKFSYQAFQKNAAVGQHNY